MEIDTFVLCLFIWPVLIRAELCEPKDPIGLSGDHTTPMQMTCPSGLINDVGPDAARVLPQTKMKFHEKLHDRNDVDSLVALSEIRPSDFIGEVEGRRELERRGRRRQSVVACRVVEMTRFNDRGDGQQWEEVDSAF
jgi:hypothetical protein